RFPRRRAGGGLPGGGTTGGRLPRCRTSRGRGTPRGRLAGRAAGRGAADGFGKALPGVLDVLLELPDVGSGTAVDARPRGVEALLDGFERGLQAFQRCAA